VALSGGAFSFSAMNPAGKLKIAGSHIRGVD
jgi:hypothetical protein